MDRNEVYTVQQFCDAHQLGRNLFYKMLAEGTGPAVMKVGRRTLISRQSAQEWREMVEQRTVKGSLVAAGRFAGSATRSE